LILNRVKGAQIDSIKVSDPSAGCRGVVLAKVQQAHIGSINVSSQAQAVPSAVDVGGGDAADITHDLVIDTITWQNTLNTTATGLLAQGGPFAPVNWSATETYYNGGQAQPAWKTTTIRNGTPAAA